eukprot:1152030-Pelagomonas_calceolata.AAC.16
MNTPAPLLLACFRNVARLGAAEEGGKPSQAACASASAAAALVCVEPVCVRVHSCAKSVQSVWVAADECWMRFRWDA